MSDGEAFIKDEPLVYGPMTREPTYWLAWALETTQECNGPRDSRSTPRLQEAGGSLRIQDEAGEVLDTDCDNITPVRDVILNAEDMDRILASCTPKLRLEICKDYSGYPEGVDCEIAELADAALWVTTEQGYLAPLDEVPEATKKLKAKLLR